MSYRNYTRLANGYWLRHARYLEGCRLTAYTILSVNKQKGKTLPKPDKIWPLLIDEEAPALEMVRMSPEEMQAIHNRYFPKT